LGEQIILNENEYELAELLSKQKRQVTSNRIAQFFNSPGIGIYYWRNSDKTRPNGKWTYYKVEDVAQRLLSIDLIAEFSVQYGNYPAYFMAEYQKEKFKTVQLKCRYTPKPKGRRRKYKNNAEKQKAYRERKRTSLTDASSVAIVLRNTDKNVTKLLG